MAAEILASSLINKVSFKVDFASYRTAIRTINRVKDEMKKLNKTNVMAASPSAAKAQVRAVRKQASEMANAHVQTFGNVIKARTASQKQFMQNFLGQNDKQIKGAAKASANVFAEAFASKPIFGPSKQDFLTNKAQAAAAALQAKRQAGVDNRIGAKTSAFNFESQRMTRLKPNEIAQYTAKVKLLNEQYRSGSLPLIQYNERMRQLTGSMRTQNAESLTLVERLRSVRSQLLFAGLTGGMALKGIADTGKDLENTGIMMSTVFGDQVGSQEQFLRDQSNRLGISFQDSAKNFSQMMFAGQQAGMGMGDMQDIFLGITEASKVFGMSQDETAGSMRAIIQMFSKGTVQAEELRGQLGDRLVGAYNIAANAMGMTTQELGVQLKAGKILAKDMVPKLAKALRELAAPGLEKSLKSLTTTEQRMLNTWVDFKNQIFTSGLGSFLGGLYTTFGNLLILMKPLANILGGITKGIRDVLYPIEYAIALFLDWAEAMGYLDSTTQNWSKSAQKEFEDFGQVIGWVLGVWGVSKIYLMIKELWKMIGVINRARTAMLALATTQAATSFVGPMPQGTPPTGTPSTGSVGGGLTGLLGLGFAWDKFTKSDLYTGREATPLAKGETDITKQFAAMPTIWDSINELKKIATSTTPINNQYYNPYQGTTGVPQTVPITLDIKVTGDAMSQHFTKELGNNTTAQ